MNWKNRALLAPLVGSMGMLVGCGPDYVPPPPAATYTYVLSTGDFPASADGVGVGFNLDDAVSDGATEACNDAPDVTSSISGEAGVDNSFAPLAAILDEMIEGGIQGALEEAIAAGTFLLLVEVSDIDSTTADASVGVRVFLGTTTETITLEGGRIAAGQTFTEGTVLANIPIGGAAITAGVLTFSTPTLPLHLSIDGSDIALTLRDAELRADISATGLTNGEIGASIVVADMFELDPEFLVRAGDIIGESPVRSLADLEPTAADDTVCDSISVGLSFEAVSANP